MIYHLLDTSKAADLTTALRLIAAHDSLHRLRVDGRLLAAELLTPEDRAKTVAELQAAFIAGGFVRSDDWRWVFTKQPDHVPLPDALAPMLTASMTAAECLAFVETHKDQFSNRYPDEGVMQ